MIATRIGGAALLAAALFGAGELKLGEKAFVPVVGNWGSVKDGGKDVVVVDGREWKRGQVSAGFADKARLLYGAKHDEFVDSVKAFAYFPIAVAQGVDDFHDGEISMRFKLMDGALDQCAGILFNVKTNGDYLTVRYNRKDTNLVLWTFNKGVRKFVKKGVEDATLDMKTWHTIKIAVDGTRLQGFLDGKAQIDYTLAAPVSGKIGLWSKTDSVSYFDDYLVKMR